MDPLPIYIGFDPSQDAAALEQHHLVAPLLELDRRSEAREAAPDDDDLHAPQ